MLAPACNRALRPHCPIPSHLLAPTYNTQKKTPSGMNVCADSLHNKSGTHNKSCGFETISSKPFRTRRIAPHLQSHRCRENQLGNSSEAGGWGGGCTHVMHGRSRMAIDPCTPTPTMPERSTSSFHRPGRHCLHQARSKRREVFGESHEG